MFSVLLLAWLTVLPVPVRQAEEAPERIPLDQILTPHEESDLYRKTRYKDKVEVLRKVMERRSKRLETELDKRNLAVIFRTLAELRSVSSTLLELSVNETNEKDRRDKQVKKLEIYLRKLSEQLSTQMLLVPLENRNQFQETVRVAEKLRDQLLQQLFGKAIGQLRPGHGPPPHLPASRFAPASAPAAGASAQRGLWDIDKFTEEEYQKVQYAQELPKRVEVFLKIATARLDEIDRRREGREWDEEEPNPLEFYTYEDLLHGYDRAINGIMTNIDEKARTNAAKEKDIREALKNLKEKIDKFIPRLQALEDLVREQKDLAFYKQYREALRSSDIARKGALYGLGAPEE